MVVIAAMHGSRDGNGVLIEKRKHARRRMAYLTKEMILTSTAMPEEDVDVPEWGGGTVRCRGLTKTRQTNLRKSATVGKEVDTERLELLLFINCVVEPVLKESD